MALPFDPHAAEREKWRAFPRARPDSVVAPGPGQRSVWDFPRPPRIEPVPATTIFMGLTVPGERHLIG